MEFKEHNVEFGFRARSGAVVPTGRPHRCRRRRRPRLPARHPAGLAASARLGRARGTRASPLREVAPPRGVHAHRRRGRRGVVRRRRAKSAAERGLDLDAVRVGHLEGDWLDPRCASLRVREVRTARAPILVRPDRVVAWRARMQPRTRVASSTAPCDASWPSDARVHRRPCHPVTPEYLEAMRAAGVSDVDGVPAPGVERGSPPRAPRPARDLRRGPVVLGAGDLVRIRSAGPRARPPPERSGRRAAHTHQRTTRRLRGPHAPDVEGALDEMAYALDELELDGVGLLTNICGEYLGDPAFDAIFAEAERRGTVISTHPVAPVGYERFAVGYAAPALEYPFETTRMLVNLVASGTLRRHPSLKLIASHGGGTIPFLAERIAGISPYFNRLDPPITPPRSSISSGTSTTTAPPSPTASRWRATALSRPRTGGCTAATRRSCRRRRFRHHSEPSPRSTTRATSRRCAAATPRRCSRISRDNPMTNHSALNDAARALFEPVVLGTLSTSAPGRRAAGDPRRGIPGWRRACALPPRLVSEAAQHRSGTRRSPSPSSRRPTGWGTPGDLQPYLVVHGIARIQVGDAGPWSDRLLDMVEAHLAAGSVPRERPEMPADGGWTTHITPTKIVGVGPWMS